MSNYEATGIAEGWIEAESDNTKLLKLGSIYTTPD